MKRTTSPSVAATLRQPLTNASQRIASQWLATIQATRNPARKLVAEETGYVEVFALVALAWGLLALIIVQVHHCLCLRRQARENNMLAAKFAAEQEARGFHQNLSLHVLSAHVDRLVPRAIQRQEPASVCRIHEVADRLIQKHGLERLEEASVPEPFIQAGQETIGQWDLLRSEAGQDAVEYALLTALVVFLAAASMQALGAGLAMAFANISNSLASSLT